MCNDVPVDSCAEGAWLIQAEARCEQGSLMKQQHQVLDCLVALVSIRTLAQLLQKAKQQKSAGLTDKRKHCKASDHAC